eukprot:18299-Heterococcus_DN1.PRE.2
MSCETSQYTEPFVVAVLLLSLQETHTRAKEHTPVSLTKKLESKLYDFIHVSTTPTGTVVIARKDDNAAYNTHNSMQSQIATLTTFNSSTNQNIIQSISTGNQFAINWHYLGTGVITDTSSY